MLQPPVKVLAIIGPTAVGKSELALRIAKKVGGEIVSADSMQVYKGMDIGTSKPSPEIQEVVPHHLIDIVTPEKNFSVALYQRLARESFKAIVSRGHLPILVGGSGLYIRGALDDLRFPKGELDSSLRKKLEEKAKRKGREAIHKELETLDPEAAELIPASNVRRVIRALEIIYTSGELFSKHRKGWKKRKFVYPVLMIGLKLPRQLLYEKIEKRVDEMVEKGLLKEVEKLKKNYKLALTPCQAIGYKEFLAYLDGEITWEESVNLIKKRTRHYAKRQMSWFKSDPRIKWFDLSKQTLDQVEETILSQLAGEMS
jgi:tRNA dimethylallyltransferase